jgi:hypothetical protein
MRAGYVVMGAHEEGEQTMQATRDTDQLAAIAEGKYIRFTTYKRDGTPVGTPLHVAAEALATQYPILHGRLIPWYHRRKGLTTTQLELTAR